MGFGGVVGYYNRACSVLGTVSLYLYRNLYNTGGGVEN